MNMNHYLLFQIFEMHSSFVELTNTALMKEFNKMIFQHDILFDFTCCLVFMVYLCKNILQHFHHSQFQHFLKRTKTAARIES